MLPYLFLLAVPSLFALGLHNNKNINFYLFIVAIIYILFIGCRFQTGSDWIAYTAMYQHISQIPLIEAMGYTELGYALLNWLMAQAGVGLVGVNIIVAGIFIFGLINFAKNMPQPWLALVSVTPYLIIVIGMSATRQSAAIGFVFLVLSNWNKSISIKIFLSLLATSFHYSAIIVLFFVLFSMNIPSWLKWQILILGGVISVWVLKDAPKLVEYHQTYVVANIVSPGALQHVLLNALPAIFYLLYKHKWDKVYVKITLIEILSFASIISLFFVFISSTAVDRLSLYLSPIQMMVYSTLPVVFKNNIYSVAIVFFNFLILLAWLTYSNTAFVFLPYKNFIFQ